MKFGFPFSRVFAFGCFFVFLIECDTVSNFHISDEKPEQEAKLLQIEGSAEKRNRYEIIGNEFVIATDHPLASEAGVQVFKEGGNVVDAFASASFVISVVRPHSTGLLGGGFAIINFADSRTKRAFDFRERASKQAKSEFYFDTDGKPDSKKILTGPYSVGVPGNIQGILTIQKKYGKLPPAKIIAPAINAARRGISVYGDLAKTIQNVWPEMNTEMKQIFGKENRPLREGELLVQEDLAKTLEKISENGISEITYGSTAKRIIEYYESRDRFLSSEDLLNYKVKESDPLLANMFGQDVLMMPPPSSSVFLGLISNVYSELKSKKPFPSGNVGEIIRITEAMKVGYRDRLQLGGDPEFTDVPINLLLSQSYAKKEATEIVKRVVAGSLAENTNPNLLLPKESYNTTHISVLDRNGDAVSSTQSINGPFGAAILVPDTGLILNNTMDDFSIAPGVPNLYGLIGSEANSISPGKTPLSSMSPLIFVDTKGVAELVIGAPGGSQIPTSIFNTLYHYKERKRTLYESVSFPRLHHQFLPEILYIDPEYKFSFPEEELKFYKIQYQRHRAKVFAVTKEGQKLVGVSDPKGEGIPLGF
ncbi:MAG: gamma-glutamyltransferase [Leptospira sp.]|nr:gamma-glutamyltransferase [Leptospira sp.]